MPSSQRRAAWLPLSPCGGRSGIRPWLGERGSLTARLRALDGTFSLRRLGQRSARVLLDEAALLGQRPARKAWAREVLLCVDGVPMVYAHSVARAAVLSGAWRLLRGIGSRPVGDAVFARPMTRRGDIRVRRLRPGHPLQRAACAATGVPSGTPLWARRSAFVHAGQALWVTEVFLPALPPAMPAPARRRR